MTSDRRTFLTSAGLTVVAVGAAVATGCTPSKNSATDPPLGNAVTIPADSIPVGGGKILDQASFVVTQPVAGQFMAFNKMCTHKGCPVSAVQGAEIVCRCHGARFSIADGSVTNGPATRPLKAARAVVDGTNVRVSA